MKRKNKTIRALFIFLLGYSTALAAQSQNTVFSSPDELRQWVNVIDDSKPVSIQTLQDQTGSYIRISPATNVYIGRPSSDQIENNTSSLPALMTPATQNAIKIRLRHTTAFKQLCGFWLHQTTFFDGEHYQQVPFFDPQPLPGDGLWHELTFSLTDSPLFDAQSDVIVVNFGFFDPGFQNLTASNRLLDQTSSTAYIDLAQITFFSVPQTLSQPLISGFTPARARYRSPVKVAGSGFVQPAGHNAVFFGTKQATVLSGDASSLTVQAESDGPISVRVPGGATATSTASFTMLGPPRNLVKVSGDLQSGAPGAVLQAIVVKVADTDGNGLPAETITFRISSGAGSLSNATATTDDSGSASTVLTLPANPGTVQVEVQHPELHSTIVFSAVATAH
jgi:hypothetical protein